MKDRAFDGQHPDEEVKYLFRHHPVVMRKGLVYGSALLLLPVLPVLFKPTLGMGWFFGGLAAGFGLMLACIFRTGLTGTSAFL